ncbi:hypothetical protein HX787_26820 [Pseudomonas tolaasii]|uniref:Uncharacterized protein n=1 Tax=Pseudomonas tolaasii TaxID=29442 RepID=A0A7Y8ASH3_PSETO|nr:hypothetical protein [Pseudomonas tolaasii]MBY8939648.1 hypothetical protein [Pseudomonas tolaasii]NWC24301.1 hypothetical protein [Pseudomonas tolaasii]NWD39476.1 hypothetical protein [Pseudomonas tolaasii]
MEAKEIKEIDLKHVSLAAVGLIQRIESILPTIPNDRVRQMVAVKLSTAISEGGNEAMLRQILILANASIESSELIEHKMNTKDLEYNPVTGEILSEINCMPAIIPVIKMLEKNNENKAAKAKPNEQKPPSSAV